MYHPFSVGETLKTSWDILRKNFAVISVYSILSLLVMGFLIFWIYFFTPNSAIGLVIFFVLLVLISYNFLAFIKLIFKLMDNTYHEFSIKEVIPTIKMVGSYLALLLTISALIVFLTKGVETLTDGTTKYILGIMEFYISQFFILFYFPLCTCFIVDDHSGPFESVAQSFGLIKGNIIKYFILFIVVEVLALIASSTIIGFILVLPVVNIVLAVTYRKLVYSHQDVDDDIAETN